MHRSDLVERLAKYQITIQAYDIKIEYRAVCQKIKTPSDHIIREELGSFPIPQRPFERLHTDIVGPLPQCIYGNSKLVICTAIPNQTTETVVKALINDVIAKHGISNEIVSDREAKDLWSDFLQPVVFAYNTSINDTTGYSPYFVAYGRHAISWSD
ncbi:hypothetical protein OESDEN_20737, partial [Oesophagostomum dentatum]